MAPRLSPPISSYMHHTFKSACDCQSPTPISRGCPAASPDWIGEQRATGFNACPEPGRGVPTRSGFLDFARNEHGYVEALLVNEGHCIFDFRSSIGNWKSSMNCLPQSQLYSKMRVPNFSNS
jgi:hypothetical protein